MFVTPQTVRVKTNTNQANQPNVDKALKQKSRRLKIRVIRTIRVRKNLKQFVVTKINLLSTFKFVYNYDSRTETFSNPGDIDLHFVNLVRHHSKLVHIAFLVSL